MENNLKKKYLLVSEKEWHDELFEQVSSIPNTIWNRISSKADFSIENIEVIQPDAIFVPHWSYIIPEEIWGKYESIVFHMTDLPYGRGGSPLQNLILRGHKTTVISALKVEKGIDSGPIYLKSPLSLEGSAKEIFKRSSSVIYNMIFEIITKALLPINQSGNIVEFKRRKPEDSDISGLANLTNVYDHIRMVDCNGYPLAFIETEFLRFEFFGAEIVNNEVIQANVRIIKR